MFYNHFLVIFLENHQKIFVTKPVQNLVRNDLNFHKSNKFDLNVRFLLLQLFSKHFLVIFQENRRKITEHCPGVVEHRRKSPENLTAWPGLSPKSPENLTASPGLSPKSPENGTAWPGLSPKSPENLTAWPGFSGKLDSWTRDRVKIVRDLTFFWPYLMYLFV